MLDALTAPVGRGQGQDQPQHQQQHQAPVPMAFSPKPLADPAAAHPVVALDSQISTSLLTQQRGSPLKFNEMALQF